MLRILLRSMQPVDVVSDQIITVDFSDTVEGTTVNSNTFAIYGSQHGPYGGTLSLMSNQLASMPETDYLPGELVTVDLTGGILSKGAVALTPYIFQFFVTAPGCSASFFVDIGQALDAGSSIDVSLGDLDGDADLDIVFPNGARANRVYTNDGFGGFADTGQALGSSRSLGIRVGDLDGDDDLDALFANGNLQMDPNLVYTNNGVGIFTDTGQRLGGSKSRGVDIGDIDGDGDLDAVFANDSVQANRIYFNNGCCIVTLQRQQTGEM